MIVDFGELDGYKTSIAGAEKFENKGAWSQYKSAIMLRDHAPVNIRTSMGGFVPRNGLRIRIAQWPIEIENCRLASALQSFLTRHILRH